MARIIYHIINPNKVTSQLLKFSTGKKVIVSSAEYKGYMIIGRYKVNKKTLRDILKDYVDSL